MKEDKLVEISGGKILAADFSTALAIILKANDTMDLAVTSGDQPPSFYCMN